MKTIIRLASIILLLGAGVVNVWGTGASLPFNFDDGYSSIASTTGMSQSGVNSSGYNSSPKLKMDGTGDYVLIEVSAAPDKLGYKIKGNPSSGTSINLDFYVLESPDGTKFTSVKYYSELSNSTTTESNIQLKRSTRYIKFMYDYKYSSGGGNVALGAISITALSSSVRTVSFSGGTTSFSARAEASVGAGITLPTATTNATSGGWKFLGWSSAAVSTKTTTVPTTIVGRGGETYYPESDITLYAVFAKGEFTKITSLGDLEVNKKYIFVQKNGANNYVMGNQSYYISDRLRVPGTLVTESASGKMHAADVSNWQYTIEGTTDNYVIRDVINSSSENYLDIAYSAWLGNEQEDGDEYTIGVSDGQWTIKNNYEDDGDYPFMAFETTYNTFYSKWSTDKVILYKETSTSYYWGSPTVVALSEGTMVHADILIDPETVSTDSETAADRQVTVTVEPSSGYALSPATRLTFTKTSGTATATYVSGPTDNGDGTYDFVYQFAQGDNGAGTIGVTAGQLSLYRTACYREFDDSEDDGLWSTEENWTGNRLPTIHERADILKPVTVDITDAKAKNVVLNQKSPNTGKLYIQEGKALTVAETVQKTTDGSTLVATGENDIVFGSTLAAGTGALVAGGYTSGDNKATVNFAVKAKKDGSGHWINQYIGTPFNDQGSVLYNYYGTQLYAFHPAKDGSYDSGTSSAYDAWWSRLAETDGMDPFMGYNILCSKAESPILWMQGTLNASSNVTFSSLAGGDGVENLLANSWMAPIHIGSFQNGDFTNVEKTIYIFNAGSPEDYASAGYGTASATAAGQYIVLPIASAPWVSPTVTVIPAMQAFSVYATGANPSLTLDYNRLVYTPALTSVGVVPTRAPRRDKVAEDAPEVISLHVTAGSGYAANAYILGREDFADSFDDGWDGRFMEGDEAAPQLYAPTENGNLVINCVPNIEGTVVCFKRGSVDSEYTFTFSYEGEESWYLNDQKEQESTLISVLDSYTFHSSADDMPARFVVSRTPIYKMPTGVEGNSQKSKVESRKMLIDGVLYIIRNGRMYDATGILCE